MIRTKVLTPVLLVLLLVFSGCSGLVRVDAIDNAVVDVTARHDDYVSNDESLSDIDKGNMLMTSRGLRETLVGAPGDTVPVSAIAADVNEVTLRHDAYVTNDDLLPQLDKSIYLREAELLRRVVEEASKPALQQNTTP